MVQVHGLNCCNVQGMPASMALYVQQNPLSLGELQNLQGMGIRAAFAVTHGQPALQVLNRVHEAVTFTDTELY